MVANLLGWLSLLACIVVPVSVVDMGSNPPAV